VVDSAARRLFRRLPPPAVTAARQFRRRVARWAAPPLEHDLRRTRRQLRATKATLRDVRAELTEARGRLAERGPESSPSAKGEQKLPADMDEEAKDIIRAVRPYTMTSADKLYTLICATRYVAEHSVPGDIVECGVWRGGSMQAAARALLTCGDTSRDLYLFDTYEGMPPPSDADVRLADGSSAE
jgi:O-methyltransferase